MMEGMTFSSSSNPFERPAPIGLGDREQRQQIEDMLRKKTRELENPSTTSTETDSESGVNEGLNPKTGEVNGPRGKEPTRYGDWAFKGRTTDF
jgi:hypothetical protein